MQELNELEDMANYFINSLELGKQEFDNFDLMKREQESIKCWLEQIGDEISESNPIYYYYHDPNSQIIEKYPDLRDYNEIHWSLIFDSL